MKQFRIDVMLADGAAFEDMPVNNRAMVDWDFTRLDKGWPEAQKAPMVWLTFLAYRQLLHNGIVSPETDFKTFREDVLIHVEKVKDEDDEAELDPTRQAAERGSASP